MTHEEVRALNALARLPELLKEINEDVERRHIESMYINLRQEAHHDIAIGVVRDARACAAAVMRGEDEDE